MFSKYKHLFFDLDNTLFDFDSCGQQVQRELFEEKKLDRWFTDYEDFWQTYKPINDGLWAKYKHSQVTKDLVKYGRFEQTLATRMEPDPELVKFLAEQYLARMTDVHILVPNCLEVLDVLKKKYTMHIISNGFIEVQYGKLENTGLAPYFDKVILSEQVKVQKPNRAIFEHAVKNANARKNQSLMIGDNPEADIKGARDFGMDQVWFQYGTTGSPEFEPTYKIKDLKELLEFL